MAIKYAMEYPQEFGVHIEQSDMFSQSGFEYKEYQSIENLVNLAQSEGVTYKDIRMLNPWIRGDNL
ncbi:MAG: hypothetical protein U9Q15_01200 [Patescibacteria group bacterium]|nr:hypothetical protein [Patescibacteria group bacterium]